MPLLRATSGNENYASKSAKVHLFAFHPDQGEKHIGFACKDVAQGGFDTIASIGYPNVIPARRNRPKDVCGKWVEGSYECAEGTMIKLYVYKSLPNNSRTACQMILMRERAAYRKILVPLCNGPQAALQEVTIEGNFDLISLEEAATRGYKYAPHFERFFSSLVIPTLMRFEVIQGEQAPIPIIETKTIIDVTGEERVVPVKRRRRSLDL